MPKLVLVVTVEYRYLFGRAFAVKLGFLLYCWTLDLDYGKVSYFTCEGFHFPVYL
jgi:hypothetical protein